MNPRPAGPGWRSPVPRSLQCVSSARTLARRCRDERRPMNWAQHAIDALGRGETAQVRPRGHSMKGKVPDGALVTLAPCDPASLQPGDVVLVRVHGSIYLHLVKAVNQGRFL